MCDSLVVPCDLQQVVVVADKGVEADSHVGAGDLQGGGGVCWRRRAVRGGNTTDDKIRPIMTKKLLLPITLKTSFIRSLKPSKETIYIYYVTLTVANVV